MFLQNKRVNFAGKRKGYIKCKGEISKISKYLSRLLLMISVLKVSISKLTLEKRELMSKQETMKFTQENMTDLDNLTTVVYNNSSKKVENQKKCKSGVNLVSKVENKENCVNLVPKVKNRKKCGSGVNLVPKICYEAIALCKETVEEVVPEKIIDNSRSWQKTRMRTHYKKLRINVLLTQNNVKKKIRRILPVLPGCEDQNRSAMNSKNSNSKQCPLEPLSNDEDTNSSKINSGNSTKEENQKRCETCVNLVPKSCYEAISLCKETVEVVIPKKIIDNSSRSRRKTRMRAYYKNLKDNFLSLKKNIKKTRKRRLPGLPECEDQDRPIINCENSNSEQCCPKPLSNDEDNNNSKINSGNCKEDILSLDPLQKKRKKEKGRGERQRISPEFTRCEDQGRPVMNCKNLNSKQCPLKPLSNSEDSYSTKINSDNCKQDFLSLQKNRKKERVGGGGRRRRRRIDPELPRCEEQGRPVMNCENPKCKQCPLEPLTNYEHSKSSKINSGNCKQDFLSPDLLQKNTKEKKGGGKRRKQRISPDLLGFEDHDKPVMNCENSKTKKVPLEPLSNGENSNSYKIKSCNCKQDVLSLDPLQKNTKKKRGGGEGGRRRRRISPGLLGRKDQDRPVIKCESSKSKKCPLEPLQNGKDNNTCKINSDICKQDILSLDSLQKNTREKKRGGRRRRLFRRFPRSEYLNRSVINSENTKCEQCHLEPLNNGEDSNSIKIDNGNCKQVLSAGKHTDTRHKILLLSDSHGRHCAGLLNQTLPSKYFASSTIKPSAQMKHVVSNIEEMIKDFNKLDCLIILAGANDIQTDFKDFQCTVNDLLANTTNTRVIMCTVPYRFDKTDCNEKIYEINEFLVESALQCSHAKIVDVNVFLRKRDYTRHGLHLVMKGKEKLCRNLHGSAMLQPITPSLITVSCSQKVELIGTENDSSQSGIMLESTTKKGTTNTPSVTNKTGNEAVMKAIPPRKKTVEEAVAALQKNAKKKKKKKRRRWRWRKKKKPETPRE